MSVYRCHSEPDVYAFEADVLRAGEGRVVLSQSWFHPGGGGQPSDRGTIEGASCAGRITGVESGGDMVWHLVDVALTAGERVRVTIDRANRSIISQLHTDTHILNALVFQEFNGALVTGARISADGTAHMDFDLPDVDNDRLRSLEQPINDVISAGLAVRAVYVTVDEASRSKGLIRSLSVSPPPTPDGRFRVIDIEGLDRQACGGTHLSVTNASLPIRIAKIDNKGRRNRRVKIELVR
ncbi:MAG TPA: alanyl-tRNA editing protein [Candidatus Acidoferrum sp.]|nr:alanyl-tRNA editing protein [Candidatus Acidoferrum sp.]